MSDKGMLVSPAGAAAGRVCLLGVVHMKLMDVQTFIALPVVRRRTMTPSAVYCTLGMLRGPSSSSSAKQIVVSNQSLIFRVPQDSHRVMLACTLVVFMTTGVQHAHRAAVPPADWSRSGSMAWKPRTTAPTNARLASSSRRDPISCIPHQTRSTSTQQSLPTVQLYELR